MEETQEMNKNEQEMKENLSFLGGGFPGIRCEPDSKNFTKKKKKKRKKVEIISPLQKKIK